MTVIPESDLEPATPAAPAAPAGWYPDGSNLDTDRYWDGDDWTDQTRAAHPLAAWVPELPCPSPTPPARVDQSQPQRRHQQPQPQSQPQRPQLRTPPARSASAFTPVPRGPAPEREAAVPTPDETFIPHRGAGFLSGGGRQTGPPVPGAASFPTSPANRVQWTPSPTPAARRRL